jgi:hypothetical protein
VEGARGVCVDVTEQVGRRQTPVVCTAPKTQGIPNGMVCTSGISGMHFENWMATTCLADPTEAERSKYTTTRGDRMGTRHAPCDLH